MPPLIIGLSLISGLVANRTRRASVLELDAKVAVLPRACANCNDVASAAVSESRAGQSLLIPYCHRCARTLARSGTAQLGAVLAASMLVVTLLLTLPWMFATLDLAAFAAIVAGVAALPLALAAFLRPRTEDGQRCTGRAVFWLRDGRLACFNETWARNLADDAAGSETPPELTSRSLREPLLPRWTWVIPVLGLALAPSVHGFAYPSLVVLNFSPTEVLITVDGKSVAAVEPTSLEARRAGTRLRVAAGSRQLGVVDTAGELVEQREIRLQAGGLHLYAVGASEYCFWLEIDRYGKPQADGAHERERQPLDTSSPFWVIPTRIDSWFGKNPEATDDRRSSGGSMVALRHARCAEAPPEVQPRQ